MTAVTTVTVVGGTSLPQWGVAMDESGINIESFKSSVKPQFIETLGNKQNVTRSVAYAPMELEVTMSGEILGSSLTGVMATVVGTAFVPANSSTYFGAPTTGLYFEGGDVTEGRNSWKKLDSATFKARQLIT